MVYIPDSFGVRLINFVINVPLGKCPLGRPRANRKIKIDPREIACDVDELAAVTLSVATEQVTQLMLFC
jgi:hypothetical protein